MAIIRAPGVPDSLILQALKGLDKTPDLKNKKSRKFKKGHFEFIYSVYKIIQNTYPEDITVAKKELKITSLQLKALEQRLIIKNIFKGTFNQAYGTTDLKSEKIPLNQFNAYLETRAQIDKDLIKICGRINLPGIQDLIHNQELKDEEKANQLRNILNDPENRANIENIRRLDLSFMRLKIIPKEINLFNSLVGLNLSGNNLTDLPEDFLNNATALTELYLNNNQIKKLPANFLDNATALSQLNLSENQIRELPVNFLNNATALRMLNLSKNQIRELPAKFLDYATALTALILNYNQISELPANFLKNANALRVFYLYNNNLTTFPENFLMNANPLLQVIFYNNKFYYQDHMYYHPSGIVRREYINVLSFFQRLIIVETIEPNRRIAVLVGSGTEYLLRKSRIFSANRQAFSEKQKTILGIGVLGAYFMYCVFGAIFLKDKYLKQGYPIKILK
jgi:Leucine-rich repeat (LRR) protein